MTKSRLLPAAFSLLLCLTSASAQDPFGADPFGGNGADPFAGAAANKPKQNSPPPSVVPGAKKATDPNAKPAQNSDEAEQRLRAALSEMTSVSFVEVPLDEAIRLISEQHDIPIVIDQRALEEIGITHREPVALTLKHVSLRSCLRLLLRELDLTYMVKDEVLQITTVEAAEQNLVLQTYSFPEMLIDKSDQVLKALTATVRPAEWETHGGPCTVSAIDNVLVVLGTEFVQEGVVEFLRKLEDAFKRHTARKPDAATQP